MSKDVIKPIGIITITKQKCILSKEHNPQTAIKKAIAKVASINATKEFVFAWQIRYKGNISIKKDDVLIAKNGLRFLVNQEQQKVAVIMCATPLSFEPNISVTLNVYRNNE
jgi:hypothetical protein